MASDTNPQMILDNNLDAKNRFEQFKFHQKLVIFLKFMCEKGVSEKRFSFESDPASFPLPKTS